MKTVNLYKALLLIMIFGGLLTSCMDDRYNDISNELNYTNFDFKTTRDVSLSITTLSTQNDPINGAYIEVYTTNPLNDDGTMMSNCANYLIYKGITDASGKLNCEIAPATAIDSLSIIVKHIGLPVSQRYKVATEMSVTIGGNSVQAAPSIQKVASALPTPTKVNGYYVLGTWKSSTGKPNYLEATNDVISSAFLADINASLPESIKLPVSHPEYLSTQDEGSIVLVEDAEVWVTFVHEGAGYLNTLGYYTHKNDVPPTAANQITDATIIFPNVSFSGSGGALVSGNKVRLLYLNPTTNSYTTIFPAGTTVAWFLKSNAYNNGTIGSGYFTFYSDKRFNPESDINYKKHNVLLKDDVRKLLVLGFEDLHRQNGSDEDFNDAVFYSTVTPYTAVKTDNYKPVDTQVDSDNDGVTDNRDEYPNDKDKAFNNYYPSQNSVGSLAFEDLWPYRGDYDFNDLVVDYNYNQILNASNKVVEIDANFTIAAIGASLRNQFAFQLNTTPENIKSVTGQHLTSNKFDLNANGTEKSQAKAVIPVFDDAFSVLGYTGSIVNTVVGGAYAAPKTVSVKIQFNTPIDPATIGTAPYNPFIVVGGVRGKEIHLPGSAPTDLADQSLLGTGNDDSNFSTAKYYMSDKYLPWAINIPVKFSYPAEKQDILKTHLKFDAWAKSRGAFYSDWYLDLNNYREINNIYK